MRNKKVIGIAVLAALCITMIAGALVIFAQGVSEDQIIGDAAAGEAVVQPLPRGETTLYKDSVRSQDIGQAVCEKYGVDFETITLGEMNRQMYDYELALELLADYGDKPLFGKSSGGLHDTLESSFDDIYADKVTGVILQRICKEDALDPKTAVIGDLTVEQLMEIQEECYQTSDHPKN